MTNKNTDAPQGEGGGNVAAPPPPPPQGASLDHLHSRGNNKVYKSGPLFLSSKGIGWTSWKKRWFILTRTSLVFYRSDPNAVPQKGAEVNLTLGGIDLNSSGSVVVKEDKKFLTVLFPDGRDGRDGRAFTLKAETLEDLYEWKTALEEALANAPSAALVMGQNGIFKNDQGNTADATSEQAKDRQPVKSLVIGRPILLALEDIDGTPSFLEKALRFLEDHGVKVEGVLRQAADVDDVEHRIREYEQGKTEFSPEEDAHVIADCIKYILRELPSSPVPASCCNALLEAYRTERSMRVTAMRTAICETFPEPNRRLLQRILMMMQTVASHKAENRMSVSAVAACMAPLLLQPLLAGDCELEHNFDMGGDGSVQLLQAAAAANHAQAIVITLLEEYDKLFGEGSVSPEPYTDSEESGSETEELTDDDENYEDDEDDYTTEGSDADVDADNNHASSVTSNETDETEGNIKGSECSNSGSSSREVEDVHEPNEKPSPRLPKTSGFQLECVKVRENIPNRSNDESKVEDDGSGGGPLVADPTEAPTLNNSAKFSNGPVHTVRRATAWGRTPARKNLSMESIDIPLEDEDEIQRLEAAKADLQSRIAEEAKGNARLQASLEKRKNDLHERRLALERDVARLQEQLQKERELRTALEAGPKTPQGQLAVSSTIDEKMKAEIQEIAQAEAHVINLKQKTGDFGQQLNQQREQNSRLQLDIGNQLQHSPNSEAKWKDKQKKVETATTDTREKSTRSKYDARLDETDCDKDKKQESLSSTNGSSLQNQQTDQGQNQKSGGLSATTSSMEQGVVRPPTNSRKSGSRIEGINSTSSALSKLTNRLNFLKERRTQIANELQNMDKSRSPSLPVQNLERGKGSEARQSLHVTDKLQGSEGQSSENNKGLDRHHQSLHSFDGQSVKGRRPDAHPNLDRGKSESFPPVEKGRSMVTPRTNSR